MVKKMKKIVKIVLCIFAILILLGVGSIFLFKSQLVPKNYPDETKFTIDQGMYGRQVFDKLEEEGIIRNADACYIYGKFLSGQPLDFKAGTFVLKKGMTLDDIIIDLCDDSKFYRPTVTITVPEGSFLVDIAKIVSDSCEVSSSDLVDYWNSESIVRSYMNEYPFLTEQIFNENTKYLLEGYLFPSTYELYANSTIDEITRRFLDQTLSIYEKYKDDFDNTPVYYHYETKEDSKATIHEIFTMASILEWESGNDEQMQDVASVFYNRLNYKPIDMLRSSVTACYSQDLGKDSCLLIDRDLELAYKEDGETYNTYTKYGLPIGPISNPGETAIYSALHPSDTDYFYFVGDICGIDGLTHFSTVEEGNEAISKKYVSCQ